MRAAHSQATTILMSIFHIHPIPPQIKWKYSRGAHIIDILCILQIHIFSFLLLFFFFFGTHYPDTHNYACSSQICKSANKSKFMINIIQPSRAAESACITHKLRNVNQRINFVCYTSLREQHSTLIFLSHFARASILIYPQGTKLSSLHSLYFKQTHGVELMLLLLLCAVFCCHTTSHNNIIKLIILMIRSSAQSFSLYRARRTKIARHLNLFTVVITNWSGTIAAGCKRMTEKNLG